MVHYFLNNVRYYLVDNKGTKKNHYYFINNVHYFVDTKSTKKKKKNNPTMVPKKKSRTRSRSPMRVAMNAMKASTTRTMSPPRAVSPSTPTQGLVPTSVTAVIRKIKTLDHSNTNTNKVITLKVTCKEFCKRIQRIQGQKELVLSNRRCRLEYDPQVSGHMRVCVTPSGTFQVVSVNVSSGTIKIAVSNDFNDADSMRSFLYREAVVGSNFTLAETNDIAK